MRNWIIFIFAMSTILFSCDLAVNETLPSSTGKLDEVLFVVNEGEEKSSLAEMIDYQFAGTFKILPAPEPQFSINLMKYSGFSDLAKSYRTIVFVSSLERDNSITKFMKRSLGPDLVNKAMTDSTFFYASKKEVWAEPQVVIFIFAKDQEALLNNIKYKSKEVVNLIYKTEDKMARQMTFAGGDDKTLSKNLREKQGINMLVPRGYKVVLDKEDTWWVRSDQYNKIVYNIAAVRLPDDGKRKPSEWYLGRDKIGKLVTTENPNTYMVTDFNLPIFQEKLNINGKLVYETKGVWSMENDFMGGAFVNYSYKDETSNEIVVIDAFVYAPGEKKRLPMRKLNAALKSLKF